LFRRGKYNNQPHFLQGEFHGSGLIKIFLIMKQTHALDQQTNKQTNKQTMDLMDPIKQCNNQPAAINNK
jgi:hypothetical protein